MVDFNSRFNNDDDEREEFFLRRQSCLDKIYNERGNRHGGRNPITEKTVFFGTELLKICCPTCSGIYFVELRDIHPRDERTHKTPAQSISSKAIN